jgi:hypothetical protein
MLNVALPGGLKAFDFLSRGRRISLQDYDRTKARLCHGQDIPLIVGHA